MHTRNIFFFILLITMLSSCSKNQYEWSDGLHAFSANDLREQVKIISSDEFEGRRPFTKGENTTIHYIASQFKAMGIEPGNDTSYFQEVPMEEVTALPDKLMQVASRQKNFVLKGIDDYVIWTQRTDSIIAWQNEEVVFAGYGIVAPEYQWDDYKDLDVKNKIVIVLVNDPGYGGKDTTFFKGNAMTYYGRWPYKFDEAARHGAKGCFVIHNTATAGYPFHVIKNYWGAPHLYLDSRKTNSYFCEGVGWLTAETSQKLFETAGLNFEEMQSKAKTRGFKGIDLHLKISTSMRVHTRFNKSHNVIGKITGTKKPEEYIIYSAHWDHLGIGLKDDKGDSIYNGAIDNASGTAGLLELAKAFTKLKNKPKRSIIFLAVTAEEQGLWGSEYYAQHPIFPIEKTVADLNMDCINPWGKMKEIIIVGKGQSDVEDEVIEQAKLLNREVVADPLPHKGHYFRSDHFSFAKVGIPSIYLNTGSNLEGQGKDVGQQLKNDYGKRYHAPSDEYDSATMNFEGGIEDLKVLFQVGKKLAFENTWPKWKANSEFRLIRERYRKD